MVSAPRPTAELAAQADSPWFCSYGSLTVVTLRVATLVLIALGLGPSGCGGDDAPPAPVGTRLLHAARASALTVTSGGEVLGGELETGAIVSSPPRATPLPRLKVSTGGQRGLLGLAADRRGRVYAAYTRRGDRRIVVDRIAPGAAKRIWTGPRSADLANGGHLEFAPDGRIVIGIGDLQNPARTPDPRAPNGKLLALRTDGRNGRPAVLSTGWNNPFAFTFMSGGQLWVADNSPGDRPERLGRADLGGAPTEVSELAHKTAPSGLAALSPTELAVCGFVSQTLDRYRLEQGRWRFAGTIARGCRYGVVRLDRGRLAFSTGRDVRTVLAR